MRNFLIYLSESKSAESFFRGFPLTKKVIKRFIAGDVLEQGIRAARNLRKSGFDAILDLLGESGDEQKTKKALSEIISMIQACEKEEDLWVGLKPTQLGLSVSKDLFKRNLIKVYKEGAAKKVKITVDMEDSKTIDDTLSVFRSVKKDLNLGICLQAYLKRTKNDLESLLGNGLRARICKGAYNEPSEFAFQDRDDINDSYMDLVKLFFKKGLDSGGYPEFATHDPFIVDEIFK